MKALGVDQDPHPPPPPLSNWMVFADVKMFAKLIIRASFMRKTFVLVVSIRMYPYVSHMYTYVSGMLVVC